MGRIRRRGHRRSWWRKLHIGLFPAIGDGGPAQHGTHGRRALRRWCGYRRAVRHLYDTPRVTGGTCWRRGRWGRLLRARLRCPSRGGLRLLLAAVVFTVAAIVGFAAIAVGLSMGVIDEVRRLAVIMRAAVIEPVANALTRQLTGQRCQTAQCVHRQRTSCAAQHPRN